METLPWRNREKIQLAAEAKKFTDAFLIWRQKYEDG